MQPLQTSPLPDSGQLATTPPIDKSAALLTPMSSKHVYRSWEILGIGLFFGIPGLLVSLICLGVSSYHAHQQYLVAGYYGGQTPRDSLIWLIIILVLWGFLLQAFILTKVVLRPDSILIRNFTYWHRIPRDQVVRAEQGTHLALRGAGVAPIFWLSKVNTVFIITRDGRRLRAAGVVDNDQQALALERMPHRKKAKFTLTHHTEKVAAEINEWVSSARST